MFVSPHFLMVLVLFVGSFVGSFSHVVLECLLSCLWIHFLTLLGVETVPDGSTLEFEYFNFMGYLKGLNPQDHIVASDVRQLTASTHNTNTGGETSETFGLQLQRSKIMDLSSSAPQRYRCDDVMMR
jgi:hypothetical protein